MVNARRRFGRTGGPFDPPFESKWQKRRRTPPAAVQRLAKFGAPGLVNFITAVAYHFCLSLPAAFTQPGALTLADLCTGLEIHVCKPC